MADDKIGRIQGDPRYRALARRRRRLSYMLTAAMLVIYYGFILTLAFWPEQLGQPIAEGSAISIGLPLGAAVIVAAVALTCIYVARANAAHDRHMREIVEAAE